MSSNEISQTMKSAKLVWQGADRDKLLEFILNEGSTVSLGRDMGNDIELQNKKVSKLHAVISWKESEFVIADQNSTNGTRVNGSRITGQIPLKDGDRIEIGDFVLSFYFLGEKPIEEFKTKRFERSELEDLEKATVSHPIMTEKLTETENMETIFPGGAFELLATQEIPPIHVEQMKTMPPEVEPAVIEQPREAKPLLVEKPKGFTHIDEAFAELLTQQTQNVQSTAQVLKERGSVTKVKLDSMIDQLGTVSKEMSELERETSDTKLAEILDKLSKNPNDVTILVELAKHSAVIKGLLKAFGTHGATLDKIRKGLENELSNYFR